MLQFDQKNRKWWILLAMSSALALVFLDQTALAVALPALQNELKLSNALLPWVINGYLLSVSVLILLGGKLGDSLGHKPIFLSGLIVFAGTSAWAALATSGSWLLLARVLQGAGCALMLPSTNALVINAFPRQERGKAMGIYTALAALFLALGPVLGGALTAWYGWRSVFWINLPVAATSGLLAASVIPKQKRTERFTVDYLGLLLSILFISGFVLCFMEGSHWGWSSSTTLGLLCMSTITLLVFIRLENRIQHPLVDVKMFKYPLFSIVTANVMMMQTVNIVFVFWAIFIQNVLQYTPLQAGICLLPSMLPLLFMAPVGGHLRDKHGPLWPMFCGCVLVTVSLAWIGFLSHYQRYSWLFPGLLAYGLGMPLLLSGSMATAMDTVSARQRGSVAAILGCARQLGSSMGLAIFVGLLNTINQWQLTTLLTKTPPPLRQIGFNQVEGLLVNPTHPAQALAHLSAQSIALLKTIALRSYTFAFSMTMYAAALAACLCLLLILLARHELNAKPEKETMDP